jgi:hypothetical protein
MHNADRKAAIDAEYTSMLASIPSAQERLAKKRELSAALGRDYLGYGMYTGRGKYNYEAAANRFLRKGLPLLQSAFGGRGMYTGRGEYVHSNNLVDGAADVHRTSIPSAMSVGDETGAIVISHREYITDIFGPNAGVAFQVLSYPLNPGLQGTFPFLSQLAQNYDEYEFIQMIWEYRSTTTDIGNSTTGQCGTVIMATNYNAAAAPFADKGLMMEYAHAQSCKVTEHMVHGVECDPEKNAGSPILYTRNNPVATGEDLKSYDLGNFQIAIANSPAAYANLPIGELWVQYAVKVRKPKLFSSRGLDIDRESYYMSDTLGTLTTSLWFGALGSVSFLRGQQNNIGCLIEPGVRYAYSGTTTPSQSRTTGSGCSILIPSSFNGNLRVTVKINGTGITGGPTQSLLGNIVPINDQYNNPGVAKGVVSNVWSGPSTTFFYLIFDIYVKQATGIAYANSNYYGGNNIISFDGATATTVTQVTIEIEQYQPLGGSQNLTTSANRLNFVNSSNVVTLPN